MSQPELHLPYKNFETPVEETTASEINIKEKILELTNFLGSGEFSLLKMELLTKPSSMLVKELVISTMNKVRKFNKLQQAFRYTNKDR